MKRLVLLALVFAACSSNSSTVDAPRSIDSGSGSGSGSGSQPTLTVNNTLSWCTVTVTVGSAAPVMFSDASDSFDAASGTDVALFATPNPTFLSVIWTGVTTMNGSNATYTMTSAAAQSVTACCPLSDGTGC